MTDRLLCAGIRVQPSWGLRLCKVQKLSAAFAQSRNNRTFEINLPVKPHEQLQSWNLGIAGGDGTTPMHELVGQILDGVAENLKRVPCLRADATRPTAAHPSSFDRMQKRKAGDRGSCHALYPHTLLRRLRFFMQIT